MQTCTPSNLHASTVAWDGVFWAGRRCFLLKDRGPWQKAPGNCCKEHHRRKKHRHELKNTTVWIYTRYCCKKTPVLQCISKAKSHHSHYDGHLWTYTSGPSQSTPSLVTQNVAGLVCSRIVRENPLYMSTGVWVKIIHPSKVQFV